MKAIVLEVMTLTCVYSSFMTEQGSHKERVIVSPSLLSWNPSDFVYHPDFNLGIREEWLSKHPVVSTSINVLNQDKSSNNDDAQFWQSIGATEDSKLIEVITEQLVSATLEEVPGGPEAKPEHFYSLKLVGWMQRLPCHKA